MTDTGTDLAQLPEDAMSNDSDLTLMDDSIAIGKWEPVETGLVQAKYSAELAVRVCAGMKLRGVNQEGKVVPLLYYDIKNGGVGLNAEIARALVSAVGNFETIEKRAELGEWWEAMIVGGKREIETLEACRGIARVRDCTTNNVTLGVCEEMFFGQYSGGGGWYARRHVAAIARAKAERDARLDHFAAIKGALLSAVRYETANTDNEYFSGEPGSLRGADAARDAIMGEHEARGKLTVGRVRAQAFTDRAKQIDDQLKGDDRDRFREDWQNVKALLAPSGLPEAPETIIATLATQFDEWEQAFGMGAEPVGPPQAPAETPEPAPTVEAPTEQALRALWKETDLTKAEIAALYKAAGIKLDADLDPETCRALWDATEATFEAGTEAAQASLGLDADDDGDGDDEGGGR